MEEAMKERESLRAWLGAGDTRAEGGEDAGGPTRAGWAGWAGLTIL